MAIKKITAPRVYRTKGKRKLVMVTAYDATFARLVDLAGVDLVLVGDSMGNVIQGLPNTLEVELEHIIYHCRCVSRGLERAHVVADMPFMSYQVSKQEALRNAGRLIREGRAESVKVEGGCRVADLVRSLVDIGIPVMGHIGLTPQSVHQFGGYKQQGKSDQEAQELIKDAKALEEAGVFSMVLEGMPGDLAKQVTAATSVPTIGIGAGPHCDGQVLVLYDLLGLDDRFNPRFLKKYSKMGEAVVEAVKEFGEEVKQGSFPGTSHYTNRKD
jgi:3-methyl-2-oxobutanoate hydroxymethyltransferase